MKGSQVGVNDIQGPTNGFSIEYDTKSGAEFDYQLRCNFKCVLEVVLSWVGWRSGYLKIERIDES